jgi:NADH-quinone oxidoreductase subunit L
METIILFAPLVGAIIAGFGWKIIGEPAAQWLTTGLLFLAAALSWVVFLTLDGPTEHIQILRFIESGTLSTDWAIRMDRLTAIMLIVVTTVSALVHLYSFGYMAHDENFTGEGENYRARFFAYLSFFTFAMLMLVTADNLIQMFFGWEGVGVASYLLIGFYYKKPSANADDKKRCRHCQVMFKSDHRSLSFRRCSFSSKENGRNFQKFLVPQSPCPGFTSFSSIVLAGSRIICATTS